MSMADILPAVRDLLTDALVTPGTVDGIYYGYDDMPQKVFRSQQSYIALEDGGESNAETNTGHHEWRVFNVKIELGVKRITGRTALPQLLDLWDQIDAVIWNPTNRRLPTGAELLSDWLGFFDVESGYLYGEDNPGWRFRSGIAPYRELICRRTWE